MRAFVLGTVFGIVISTVGFNGVAKLLDASVEKTKQIAIESTK